jgi:hypothetical protein
MYMPEGALVSANVQQLDSLFARPSTVVSSAGIPAAAAVAAVPGTYTLVHPEAQESMQSIVGILEPEMVVLSTEFTMLVNESLIPLTLV